MALEEGRLINIAEGNVESKWQLGVRRGEGFLDVCGKRRALVWKNFRAEEVKH